MERNPAQSQKRFSLNDFLERYGDENKCFKALFNLR